jgi:hypothetical protein
MGIIKKMQLEEAEREYLEHLRELEEAGMTEEEEAFLDACEKDD